MYFYLVTWLISYLLTKLLPSQLLVRIRSISFRKLKKSTIVCEQHDVYEYFKCMRGISFVQTPTHSLRSATSNLFQERLTVSLTNSTLDRDDPDVWMIRLLSVASGLCPRVSSPFNNIQRLFWGYHVIDALFFELIRHVFFVGYFLYLKGL